MDVIVRIQAQAIGTAEAQAQVMVSPEETLQAMKGDQCNTKASLFSPLCRWT